MSYEIPQTLRYSERIAFGLTLNQLVYIGVFTGAAAIVFNSKIFFEAKAIIAAALIILGLGFAFGNLMELMNNSMAFWKTPKKSIFSDEYALNFIGVKKITSNVIVKTDNSLLAVIKVKPINFMILSEEQQSAVVSKYKDFLNSLDFPIQISVKTVKLSLKNYFYEVGRNLAKNNNPKLMQLFNSFEKFTEHFIEENKVKNRLFYLVVPYTSQSSSIMEDAIIRMKNNFSKTKEKTTLELNKEIALEQLEIRSILCMEKLREAGIESKRLETKELTELISGFFDPNNENTMIDEETIKKFDEGLQ
ncbi:MAG: hypothetical protein Q7K42_04545 [Candidatus Diapherotrites archaeon]|nr:hypothetical protein [Candidatus Diapherotrites archaeon]